MTRTTILLPVLVAFIIGAVAGGRLLTAEAQRAPATLSARDCATELADHQQLLRRVRRAEKQALKAESMARARALAAEERADQLKVQLRETEALLEVTRKRLDKLTQYLGQTIEADHF